MTEVTNELMYELLKRIHADIALLRTGQHDLNLQMQAIREHMQAQNKDTSNLYSKVGSVEVRLERIERRLDLIGEPAE